MMVGQGPSEWNQRELCHLSVFCEAGRVNGIEPSEFTIDEQASLEYNVIGWSFQACNRSTHFWVVPAVDGDAEAFSAGEAWDERSNGRK